MIDVKELLYEICPDEAVLQDDTELIGSGILDSLAFIGIFERLEDFGLKIYPTRVDRKRLGTPASLQQLVNEEEEKQLRKE